MNKTISIILFVVLAVAVVGAAMWYNNKSDQAMQQAQTQAAIIAQQEQAQTLAKIMQNFKITDTVVGTGAVVNNGDTVNVLYTGTLPDGTVFDASSKHGNQPFSFTVGAQNVIQGWDLGVVGMKVGGTRELTIPPELGYGAGGYPPIIPGNTTLHFTIQLLSIATSSPTSTQ